MFEEELKYVQDYLISHNGDNSPRINETFRHRSKHVNNVFRWALRIYYENAQIHSQHHEKYTLNIGHFDQS